MTKSIDFSDGVIRICGRLRGYGVFMHIIVYGSLYFTCVYGSITFPFDTLKCRVWVTRRQEDSDCMTMMPRGECGDLARRRLERMIYASSSTSVCSASSSSSTGAAAGSSVVVVSVCSSTSPFWMVKAASSLDGCPLSVFCTETNWNNKKTLWWPWVYKAIYAKI